MRILFVATKYPLFDESPWLTNELVEELVARGHSVDVFDIEWSGVGKPGIHQCGEIYVVRRLPIYFSLPKKWHVLYKWAFSSLKLYPSMIWRLISKGRYDLFIGFSPCVSVASCIPLAKIASKKSTLVYWDFFPVHNHQISGKVPERFLPYLKRIENKLLGSFDSVGLMSQRNLSFCNEYFGEKKEQNRFILPVWTSFMENSKKGGPVARRNYGFREDDVLVVFGGQLVAGRGVETILKAVLRANSSNGNIKLVVCGSGPLSVLVEQYASNASGVFFFLGQLSRDDYMHVLSCCDVGVVATVEGVESPTYPSKCLDYMASKLPIAASVEGGSDFGEIIESNEIGFSCLAGDYIRLSDILIRLSLFPELRRRFGEAGFNFLNRNHSVRSAAIKILEA